MRLTDIQNAIVACFFSHDLKQYIEENARYAVNLDY